jgi:16S rRNA (uracil1498-N3)-methyltransferase
MRDKRKKILSITFCFLVSSTLSLQGRKASIWPPRLPAKYSILGDILPNLPNEKYTSLPRLYVGPSPTTLSSTKPVPLAIDTRIKLSPEQAHYVTKVMRIGGKESSSKNLLRIFDGANGEWLTEVCLDETNDSRNRRRSETVVSAKCLQQLRTQPTSTKDPWLYLAPLKKARIKMILEKCTELGVGGFTLLSTDRTDPTSCRDCQDTEKLAIQIIEASEQCERLTIPPLTSIEEEMTVESLLEEYKHSNDKKMFICRERSGATPILGVLSALGERFTGISFLIGPEGGWSEKEEMLFEKNLSDSVCGVSLGSSVLRAETAAMTAVAAFALHRDLLPESS